jgi:hypothetical protein
MYTRTPLEVESPANIDSAQGFQFDGSTLVLRKERVFERRVVVIDIAFFSQKMRSIDMTIQVHKGPAASHKLLAKEQMDGLLCRDVPV